MAAPEPEVDIPAGSHTVLACYSCLGTGDWTQGEDGMWRCGACGGRKALLTTREGLAETKVHREANT